MMKTFFNLDSLIACFVMIFSVQLNAKYYCAGTVSTSMKQLFIKTEFTLDLSFENQKINLKKVDNTSDARQLLRFAYLSIPQIASVDLNSPVTIFDSEKSEKSVIGPVLVEPQRQKDIFEQTGSEKIIFHSQWRPETGLSNSRFCVGRTIMYNRKENTVHILTDGRDFYDLEKLKSGNYSYTSTSLSPDSYDGFRVEISCTAESQKTKNFANLSKSTKNIDFKFCHSGAL